MGEKCIVEIVLRCGDKSRYEFTQCDHTFFIDNKVIFGKNIYSGNEVGIRTKEIAKYEIIRK